MTTVNADKDAVKVDPSYTAGGIQSASALETVWQLLKKNKNIYLPYDKYAILRIYSRDTNTQDYFKKLVHKCL